MRVAPASDGVELSEIRIERRIALAAVKYADLTNMRLELWFPRNWKQKPLPDFALIQFESLDPIEDDTGKLLSTEKRLRNIEAVSTEVRVGINHPGYGTFGPSIRLLLDAPAHGATRIKAIRGKARVSLCEPVELRFDDLTAWNDKHLEHADLKDLKAMKLRFSSEEKGDQVTAKIWAPVNYASPWKRGRLDNWQLREGKESLSVTREAVKGDGDGIGVTVEQTYERPTIKRLSLYLTVLKPVETKTFEFNFKDVELP